ncbi:nitrate ABC transporter permease [Ktedonobacter sp. SOSP1-85]|uniref:ABC transporter permease n=1 Tax=Ktedonobacter sp. SOSP1-85 TaxID=2778367 RepID=UPI001916220D|nr:ABC transporter permease [Ktedonobacter sp. SOSP1-85]GHO75787.1 nitrate ABC transporter permease [Ktedonobacter sp. SOSP1-85]
MNESRWRRFAAYGPAFVLVVALLLLWEVGVRAGRIDAMLVPAPSAILEALGNKRDVLLTHSIQTMLETVLGLALATVLGVAIAVAIDLSSWLRRALYPLLVASQTIPMVALAPLLLVWFGFDILPKVILVVLYCFFPITVACADGLLSVDPDLVRLMRSMRASRWQILWLVRLPGAMPSFFSGLRIAATYSVTGAIIGEYVGAEQGLGIFMQTSANAHAIVLVFAAIVITTVLSLALFALVSLVERIVLPWQESEQRRAFGAASMPAGSKYR